MTSKLMYRSHLGDLRSAKRLGKTTANVYITREIVCRFWIAQWRRQFEAFVKGLQSVILGFWNICTQYLMGGEAIPRIS